MLILTKTQKPAAAILPHPIYIVGDHFYNAGETQRLGMDYCNLADYLAESNLKPDSIEKVIDMVKTNIKSIDYNEDWDALRNSKWWEWACVRQLAYQQGRHLDCLDHDPAEVVQENFKHVLKEYKADQAAKQEILTNNQ